MTPYYAQDGITIYHGDCREVLPTLPEVDLVFTSPPYNLGMTAHYAALGGRGRPNPALANGYGDFDDCLPWDEYRAWQREVLTLCWDRLSAYGAIFYNHKPRPVDRELFNPLDLNPGLPLRQIIIWRRSGGVNYSRTHFLPVHEWLILFAKPDFCLVSKSASSVGDVWDIAQEARDLGHPCPFPVELPKRAIGTTGANLILDPFCGSGTTLVAAKEAACEAIGIEVNERYCEIAAKRLSQGVLFAPTPLALTPTGRGRAEA